MIGSGLDPPKSVLAISMNTNIFVTNTMHARHEEKWVTIV